MVTRRRTLGSNRKLCNYFAAIIAICFLLVMNQFIGVNMQYYVILEDNTFTAPPLSISKSMSIQPNSNGEDNDIMFEGSSNFLLLLRQAHQKEVLNPLPQCQQHHNISIDSRIRPFNRGIEVDFVGKAKLNAVLPTWSSPNTSSHFHQHIRH